MRRIFFICLLAILVCGCDPAGVRRVQLQFRNPSTQSNSIAVDAPDIQEALQILDTAVSQHGFVLSPQPDPNYIRIYSLPIKSYEGEIFRTIPCRVSLISNGLWVTFGEYGFLGSYYQAGPAFKSVRDAFIKRYGKKCVRSRSWGPPNKSQEPNRL
jgi:hypothetical protein